MSDSLIQIYRRYQQDEAFAALRETATQFVPGHGNPDADVMFVGEAPGANEDRQGRPFVGRSGKFLEELLSSIELTRADVFITNIVKYRPPNNRDPELDEVVAGRGYLRREIMAVCPRLVVLLGSHALKAVDANRSLSKDRAVPFQINPESGVWFLALYHPAVALYSPKQKGTLLHDFAAIRTFLEAAA